MNEMQHDEQHKSILNELDHVSDVLSETEKTETDLLRRIEALEKEVFQ